MLASPLNITALNIRVGFFKNRLLTKLTTSSGESVALPPEVGRFELLNIVQNRTDASINFKRVPLVACSHSLSSDANLLCARANETMNVYGDEMSDQTSVWTL